MSNIGKLGAIFLACFCASSKLKAQSETAVPGEKAPNEINDEWMSLKVLLRGFSAEDRIRKVEEWKVVNEKVFLAQNQAKFRSLTATAVAPPRLSKEPLDQSLNEPGRLNCVIVSDLEQITKQKLTSEERIRKVDELLAKHKTNFAEAGKKIAASSRTSKPPEKIIPSSEVLSSPIEQEAAKIVFDVRRLLFSTSELSETARIAAIAIDAPAIRAREQRLNKLRENQIFPISQHAQ